MPLLPSLWAVVLIVPFAASLDPYVALGMNAAHAPIQARYWPDIAPSANSSHLHVAGVVSVEAQVSRPRTCAENALYNNTICVVEASDTSRWVTIPRDDPILRSICPVEAVELLADETLQTVAVCGEGFADPALRELGEAEVLFSNCVDPRTVLCPPPTTTTSTTTTTTTTTTTLPSGLLCQNVTVIPQGTTRCLVDDTGFVMNAAVGDFGHTTLKIEVDRVLRDVFAQERLSGHVVVRPGSGNESRREYFDLHLRHGINFTTSYTVNNSVAVSGPNVTRLRMADVYSPSVDWFWLNITLNSTVFKPPCMPKLPTSPGEHVVICHPDTTYIMGAMATEAYWRRYHADGERLEQSNATDTNDYCHEFAPNTTANRQPLDDVLVVPPTNLTSFTSYESGCCVRHEHCCNHGDIPGERSWRSCNCKSKSSFYGLNIFGDRGSCGYKRHCYRRSYGLTTTLSVRVFKGGTTTTPFLSLVYGDAPDGHAYSNFSSGGIDSAVLFPSAVGVASTPTGYQYLMSNISYTYFVSSSRSPTKASDMNTVRVGPFPTTHTLPMEFEWDFFTYQDDNEATCVVTSMLQVDEGTDCGNLPAAFRVEAFPNHVFCYDARLLEPSRRTCAGIDQIECGYPRIGTDTEASSACEFCALLYESGFLLRELALSGNYPDGDTVPCALRFYDHAYFGRHTDSEHDRVVQCNVQVKPSSHHGADPGSGGAGGGNSPTTAPGTGGGGGQPTGTTTAEPPGPIETCSADSQNTIALPSDSLDLHFRCNYAPVGPSGAVPTIENIRADALEFRTRPPVEFTRLEIRVLALLRDDYDKFKDDSVWIELYHGLEPPFSKTVEVLTFESLYSGDGDVLVDASGWRRIYYSRTIGVPRDNVAGFDLSENNSGFMGFARVEFIARLINRQDPLSCASLPPLKVGVTTSCRYYGQEVELAVDASQTARQVSAETFRGNGTSTVATEISLSAIDSASKVRDTVVLQVNKGGNTPDANIGGTSNIARVNGGYRIYSIKLVDFSGLTYNGDGYLDLRMHLFEETTSGNGAAIVAPGGG